MTQASMGSSIALSAAAVQAILRWPAGHGVPDERSTADPARPQRAVRTGDGAVTSLAKGANLPIAAAQVRAELSWTGGPGVPDVDGSALLLQGTGKVSGDDDFVFFNQPRHPSGAVRHVGKNGTVDAVELDLHSLPPMVERVVLAASADGGTFGQVPDLRIVVKDLASGTELADFTMVASQETAFLSGEFYRRNGQWKFRAVGQGYATGLAGIATDFGISVDEPPPAAPPQAAWAPPPTASAAAPFRGTPPPPPPGPAPQFPSTPAPPPPGVGPTFPGSSFAGAPPAFPPAHPPQAAQGAQGAPVNLDKGRVSLTKGDRVSLVKRGAPPLAQVTMGLGWDPARGRRNIDLDASCIAFDQGGRQLAIVWFMHLGDFGGALQHAGDNLTGQGDGDDEKIHVNLQALPPQVSALVFTINSFRGQKFTDVANAFCRLVDSNSQAELVRFDLSNSEAKTGVLMAVLSRQPDGTWEMRAIGEFHNGRTVKKLVEPAARWATMP